MTFLRLVVVVIVFSHYYFPFRAEVATAPFKRRSPELRRISAIGVTMVIQSASGLSHLQFTARQGRGACYGTLQSVATDNMGGGDFRAFWASVRHPCFAEDFALR
jgi:hypothetical protein